VNTARNHFTLMLGFSSRMRAPVRDHTLACSPARPNVFG
jgi:hypothetical protein